MLPYLGCAQETHQTAPSWLGGVRGVGENMVGSSGGTGEGGNGGEGIMLVGRCGVPF